MKIDSVDRDKLRKYLVTFIALFSVNGHRQEIVHMHLRKLSNKEINVNLCKAVGEKQLQQFISDLADGLYKPLTVVVLTIKKLKKPIKVPDGFYKPLTVAVLTIKKLKKSIKVKEVEVIDISFIYCRVIAIQLTNEILKVKNVFSFELSPVPTSMFDDIGDMRSAKSKSGLNNLGKTCHFSQ